MLTKYDSALFDPPAPVAQVTLRNPVNDLIVSDVLMLLDTGADITMLPQRAIQRLGVETVPDKYYELMSFDGSTSLAAVVRLELIFLGRTFKGQFLLSDQECGVIGRNILNVIPLLLDGPRLVWSEQRP